MYYNELKMYCKSEGLSEYLLSEMKLVSPKKSAVPAKDTDNRGGKKAQSGLKRVV
jgi:hypothetical protein